jgi:uncharacterized protein (DUF302 family)
MSNEYQLVEQIIKGLMNPNNEERKKNEAQLMDLMQKNKIGLVLCLTQILDLSTDSSCILYAAVIARKLIQVPEGESSNLSWKSAPNDIKEQIKDNLMKVLIKCTDKNLKKKIGNIVGNLYETISFSEEKWDTVLKYIAEGFKLPLTPENALNIDSAVYMLSKVFPYATKELTPGIDVFIDGFKKYFKEGSLQIQTNSVEAICEILGGNLSKDNKKKFKDLIFNILETILKCFESNDADNLKLTLFALSDLAQVQPAMLKKSFRDIMILMGKIIENKNLDEDSLRGVAFEVIISIVENHPKVISEDNEKLNMLINSIYRYAMEIDEDIDEDWLTPKSLSITEMDFIPEEKLDEALSLIDRIILGCKSKVVLPLISKIVMELLNHKAESWKYKYIAYVSVGKIANYVEHIKDIEQIIPIILDDIKSENPKIRYGCLYCISEFSTELKDEFTEFYADKVIPSICNLVMNDNVLRCKLQGYDSLESFINESSEDVLGKYTQDILDALFVNFLKSNKECPQSMQEAILDCLGELLSRNKSTFSQYSLKTFNILAEYLGKNLKNNDYSNINLFGLLIEILTKVGEDCPDLLKKGTKDIAETLINFQNNIKNFKGEISQYFVASWERILPYIKTDYKDLIPSIINSIICVITKPPEMSIDSNPEKKIDIQDFLKDINEKEKVTLEKKKITIVTSETEEYSSFIDLLNLILSELKEFAIPYIDLIEKQAKSIISYPNIDIRGKAATIFPKIVNIIATAGDQAKLSQYLKNYLTILVGAAEKETENEVVSYLLQSVDDCITGHDKTLSQEEVNQLFYKLFGIFDKVEKNRINLNKEKGVKELETEKKKAEPQDEDIDDNYEEEIALDNIKEGIEGVEDIITAFSDAIGALFKTHKEFSMEIAKKMISDVLPKYFQQNASNFEKKMGLFIMDDMVEFLGQELLDQIWPDIAKTLITYVDNHSCEIRQAASYGLGEFIKHTNVGYNKYAEEILKILYKGLEINSDGENSDEYQSAQDNIVTALGKLIKFRGNEYPNLKEIISKWLYNLPIQGDISESPGQHDLLCDIVMNSPDMIFGDKNDNVPKIIRILCKVYDSKYSNKDVNEKIKKIIEGIKKNGDLMACIPKAKENASKKVKSRIEKYFS